MAETLVEHGFTGDDADRWALAHTLPGFPEYAVRDATAYRDLGFTTDTAIEWFTAEIDARVADVYAKAGWQPREARWLRTALQFEFGSVPRRDQLLDLEATWLATGLPSDRCVAFLDAGVAPGEATAYEDQIHAGDEDTAAAIDLLAALRGHTPGSHQGP